MGVRTSLVLGQRFGRLVVVEMLVPAASGRSRARFICSCGNEKIAKVYSVVSGGTSSCGCLRSENINRVRRTLHGMTHTPEFRSWSAMISRCTNPNTADYYLYGGRGIAICERWRHSFSNFFSDMGQRPPGTTLDRRDNDKGYEPANCRWATNEQQQRNKRTVRRVFYQGAEMLLSEACEKAGLSPDLVTNRLAYGWTVERALSEPKNLWASRPWPESRRRAVRRVAVG